MFCEFCIVLTTNVFLGLDVRIVTESGTGSRSSSLQHPSSHHPPSSESQMADRTERDENLDGPTAPNQLSDTDHGMDSHVLNSENQYMCVCVCT